MTDSQMTGDAGVIVAPGQRFHLDEDRIRELLMGVNLYGDPSLALRELYQNAVDACRLADARQQFLGRPTQSFDGAPPDITIEQGVDARGRAYVECVDRGAGMGLDELTLAFCRAGGRASDLIDRQAESADFAAATPPIELWLNSRFGIGVMSYFMIADAVSVTTARLNRDGSVGDRLTVAIPGPAASFDVVSHGQAAIAGTRLRLLLKPGIQVSAVTTLRDLIIVCPYRMTVADHRGRQHQWMPGELNRASAHLRLAHAAVAGRPEVWWTPYVSTGTVLADGVWADTPFVGMIVNLTGSDSPRLTADRRKIIELDLSAIEALAVRAADDAVERGWPVVGTASFLSRLSMSHARVADAIVRAAGSRSDRTVTIDGIEVDIRRSGYVLGDDNGNLLSGMTPTVSRWRFTRLTAGGLHESIGIPATSGQVDGFWPVPARPSDIAFLGNGLWTMLGGTHRLIGPWFGSFTSVYQAELLLGYGVQEVIARARVLGLDLPADAEDSLESSAAVRSALSFSRRSWHDGTFRPVQAFDVLQASWHLGLTPSAVLSDLDERSIEYSERCRTLESEPPLPAALLACSKNHNGIAPWLPSHSEVGLPAIVEAAREGGLSPRRVIEGLSELGFEELPVLVLADIEIGADDVVMLSRDLDGSTPFLRSDIRVPSRRLELAAIRLSRPLGELAARFALFGISFGDEAESELPQALTKKEVFRLLGLSRDDRRALKARHQRAMGRDGHGEEPWLDPRHPVPAWRIATRALAGRSVDKVIRDLHRLGYRVEDPREAPPALTPGHGAG